MCDSDQSSCLEHLFYLSYYLSILNKRPNNRLIPILIGDCGDQLLHIIKKDFIDVNRG